MAKFKCPYCYGIHDTMDCPVRCSDQNYSTKGIRCIHGIEREDYITQSGAPITSCVPKKFKGKCDRCRDSSLDVYCPTEYQIVPRDYLSSSGLSVALVGAKASGKSNYIGVLVNEIRKKMVPSFNCSLNICCSEESKRYYDETYYKPLYEQGYVVAGTNMEVIPPLLFPVNFMDPRGRIRNTVSLTFYDSAGEVYNGKDDILIFGRYIPNSDGIILLLDPLQLPTVREKLKDKMELPEQNTDVIEILSRIVQNIRSVSKVKGNIKIPLAVAFTKIDALIKFGVIPADSIITQESEHLRRGVFVLSDFNSVNQDMTDMLEHWLDDELLQLMKNFEKYSFFGVSSLGDVPRGGALSGSRIKPLRVLDPLLWILAEHNYIKKVKI